MKWLEFLKVTNFSFKSSINDQIPSTFLYRFVELTLFYQNTITFDSISIWFVAWNINTLKGLFHSN